MKLNSKHALALAVAGALAAPMAAHATNGYFAHGWGLKSKGMAGVGAAHSVDSIAAAVNPAGMVNVGDRIDFGADVFRPQRNMETNGTAGGTGFFDQDLDGDETEIFVIVVGLGAVEEHLCNTIFLVAHVEGECVVLRQHQGGGRPGADVYLAEHRLQGQ